jgi:hypothetical protein
MSILQRDLCCYGCINRQAQCNVSAACVVCNDISTQEGPGG